MLTAYINAAMHKAHYEVLDEGEGYIGKIPVHFLEGSTNL